MIKNILITTAISLFFSWGLQALRNLFPYQPPSGATRWNLEQLGRLYARVDNFVLNLMLVGPAVLAFVWYLLLVGWLYLTYPDPGTPGMIMTPPRIFFLPIAVFAGWATVEAFRHAILRRVLGRRYGGYCVYQTWRFGRALPVVYKAAKIISVLLLIVLIYSLSSAYTVFRTDRIVIARPYNKVVSHPYHDIVEIRAARLPSEGTRKRTRSRYEIEFTDGTVWHAAQSFHGTDPCATFPYIAFAAERSRRPITGPDLYSEAGCKAS